MGSLLSRTDTSGEGTPNGEQLENVGFVVWQSAFVLAEYLLRMPPFGQWGDVKTVDLGTGTGVYLLLTAKTLPPFKCCIPAT